MPKIDFDHLDAAIYDYFIYWQKRASRSRADRLEAQSGVALDDWLSEALIGRDRPADEAVWQVVVALIDQAPDERALGIVAAGPLEDMAWFHAVQFGDRVVEKTRTDPRFRRAMGGILGWDRVPEPYRGRLLALLDADQGH